MNSLFKSSEKPSSLEGIANCETSAGTAAYGSILLKKKQQQSHENYRFTFAGGRSFTKEFVFKKSGNKWFIEDINTTGLEPGRRSEVAFLRKNQVTAQ